MFNGFHDCVLLNELETKWKLSQSKVKVTAFYYVGVLLLDLKAFILAIKAKRYSDNFKRLPISIKNKRSGKLTNCVIHWHHSARFHVDHTVEDFLGRQNEKYF